MKPRIRMMKIDLAQLGDLTDLKELLYNYVDLGGPDLGFNVTLNIDLLTGEVFLSNDENRIAKLDGEYMLREWFRCPQCHAEGFDGDIKLEGEGERKLQFDECAGFCSQACAQKGSG